MILLRAIVALAVMTLVLHPTPRRAAACSCVRDWDETSIRSLLDSPSWDGGDYALVRGRAVERFVSETFITYDVSVERVFRGDPPARIMVDAETVSSCGSGMPTGRSTIFSLGRVAGDRYWLESCGVSPSVLVGSESSYDIYERLAPGRSPPGNDVRSVFAALGVLGGAGVLLAGLSVVARRRNPA